MLFAVNGCLLITRPLHADALADASNSDEGILPPGPPGGFLRAELEIRYATMMLSNLP